MIHLTKLIAALLVLVALALGGYAAWLSRQAPAATSAPVAVNLPPAEPTYAVVVARRAVPAGMPLEAEALRIAQLTINPPGALHDIGAATGRTPVSNLGEGAPILEPQLASGLASRLEAGERAVAVKADEVMGVGNRVRPGDFVDVFVRLKSDNREIERSQARLLLARVRVLAFGAASVDGGPPSPDDAAGPSGPASRNAQQPARLEAARTAVLAVPVDAVARLALGDGDAHLLLALRHPNDLVVPDTRLFAVLPPALQPLAARSGGAGSATATAALAPIDLAQAGLAMSDLARGGAAAMNPVAAQPMAMQPVAAAPPAQPGRAPAAAARHGSTTRSGTEVELIRGDKRETLSY